MKLWKGILAATIGCLLAPGTFAIELVKKDHIVDNVLRKEHLVKVADNGIFLLDTSSSSNEIFEPSGKA